MSADPRDRAAIDCPGCGEPHDTDACAREQADCDCCYAIHQEAQQ